MFDNTQEDLTSLFCSEFVAEALQRMGLLGTSRPSNEYVPSHFEKDDDLDVQGGLTLGPMTEIDLRVRPAFMDALQQ